MAVFKTIAHVQDALDVCCAGPPGGGMRINALASRFERPYSALKYQPLGRVYEKGERFQHSVVTL